MIIERAVATMRAMEAIQEILRRALDALRGGDQAQAARLSDQVLQAEPEHFGALHLRGIVAILQNDAGRAIECLQSAVRLNPGMAPAHYNLGNALALAGLPDEAVASFDRALSLAPGMAEAWCNRGNALVLLDRVDEALGSFRTAIQHRPQLVDAHINLGDLLFRQGQLSSARQHFEAALRLSPDRSIAWTNHAKVLLGLHDAGAALRSAGEAIRRDAGNAEAWATRASIQLEIGRSAEACDDLARAVVLAPKLVDYRVALAEALRRARRFDEADLSLDAARELGGETVGWLDARGVLLHDCGQLDAARDMFEQALAIDPRSQSVLRHLGNLWQDLDEPDRALECLDRALDLDPRDTIALNGRGLVHTECRRFDAAEGDYAQVLALQPASGEAHKRRAILRLLQGDFASGWSDYEASLRLSRRNNDSSPGVPFWQGEDLAGKRILLSEPNGLGDTLQFIRLIPRLHERGAEVAFLGPARMLRLLRTFPEPVAWITEVGEQSFDFQSELWSLPHWLGLALDSIPAELPYLSAEPDRVTRWASWLASQPGRFRIGICWQGNPARKIDVARSVPLRMLAPLAAVPGVQLVSLQAQHGLEQLDDLPEGMSVVRPPADFDAGPDAFLDTAALMQSLDLVITIDSALTHLAGALNRPVWLALRAVPEFRWMLDRTDSPWYPTVRLFRQQRLGDWTPVYQQMAQALGEAVMRSTAASDGL